MKAKQNLSFIFGAILLITGAFMIEAKANNF